jgi:hypothetical protein
MIALSIDGTGIPAKDFIASIRACKQNPELRFNRTIKKWWPGTGAEVVREYREMINDTINRRGGMVIREQRESITALYHMRMLLNGNYVVRSGDIPRRYRRRFTHKIMVVV